MEDLRYAIWLTSIPFLMPKYQYALLSVFGSPRGVYEAARQDIAMLNKVVPEKTIEQIISCRDEGRLDRIISRIEELNIRALSKNDPAYPSRLLAIYDPPLILYALGPANLSAKRMVAMVGTRKPTEYGKSACYAIAKELAAAQVSIVSGMAYGLDIAAHRGCLDSGGTTIAVLGCGVDVIYPVVHLNEYRKIVETGAVVSEYPPGTEPEKVYFPTRNRIISGLSDGLIVVEAAERSGTLHTVRAAQDQGREVMAVPGNINSLQSVGSNRLIADGAKPILRIEDVLEQLGYENLAPRRGKQRITLSQQTINEMELTKEERLVYEYLARVGEGMADDFAESLDISMDRMNSLLTILEMRGIIKKLPGNRFMVNALV